MFKFKRISAITLIVFILGGMITMMFGCNKANGDVHQPEKETIEVEGKTYELTFYDDFIGRKLDNKKWALCPEWNRQDVGGKWDNSMTKLDGNGNLVLSAAIADDGTPISGAVRTKGIFEQVQGYFEIRCTVQSAPGFWSAFWLMSPDQGKVGNGAVDGAEIDIFEAYNVHDQGINHAIHWDGYGEYHKQTGAKEYRPDVYDGDFHTFSLLWTDTAYIFYIDGEEVYRLKEGDPDYPGCSTSPTYMKISLEFGTWAGEYDKNQLPDNILVDYVKAYKLVK